MFKFLLIKEWEIILFEDELRLYYCHATLQCLFQMINQFFKGKYVMLQSHFSSEISFF